MPLLLDRVVNDREIIYIKSQNGENVAFVISWLDAAELQSFLETVHLLRSQKNDERLLNAMSRARANTKKNKKL